MGPLADCPIIKLCPVGVTAMGVPDTSVLSSSITALSTSGGNLQNTFALLARACPGWYSGEIGHTSGVPIYDPDFMTVWSNAPYQVVCSSPVFNQIGPPASTNDTSIAYNSFDDRLDGGAYALTTIYNTTTADWGPSLLKIVTSVNGGYTTNRFTFNGTSLIPTSADMTGTFQRPDTYKVLPSWTTPLPAYGPLATIHSHNTERIYAVTINTVTQAAYEMVEYFFTYEAITLKKGYDRVKTSQKMSRLRKSNNTGSSKSTKHPSPKGNKGNNSKFKQTKFSDNKIRGIEDEL